MRTCISAITTLPTDLETDLAAFAQAGWRAVELSLEKAQAYAKRHTTSALAELLANHGLRPVGAIGLAPAGPGLLLSGGVASDRFFASLEEQLQLCAALGVETLGLGADPMPPALMAGWKDGAAANLARAAELAGAHGVRIGVEFMSLDAPIGPFVLATLDETQELVQRVGHSSLGINLDLFHFFRGGGTVESLRQIDAGQINIVHVCDVIDLPREQWADGHRVHPGLGVLPLREVRDQLEAIGYRGYWSLELLNEGYWSDSPFAVAVDGMAAMEATFGPDANEG